MILMVWKVIYSWYKCTWHQIMHQKCGSIPKIMGCVLTTNLQIRLVLYGLILRQGHMWRQKQ